MSYPRDLNEIPTAELEQELARRKDFQMQGLCDYCNRTPDTTPCRFHNRHKEPLKWSYRGSNSATIELRRIDDGQR